MQTAWLAGATAAAGALYQWVLGLESEEHRAQLTYALGLALAGMVLTAVLVPKIAAYTLKAGLFGKDLGKRGTPTADEPVPEALGIVPATVFLTTCIVFFETQYADQPLELVKFNAALLSVAFMVFLGFADDVLDLPWRYKLLLPTVATLPLLCSYTGGTSVVVPRPLRALLVADGAVQWPVGWLLGVFSTVDTAAGGAIVELGVWYYAYMSLLAIFTTNAINILAGVNGLEAGQALVVGVSVLAHNLVELALGTGAVANHLLSAMLLLPFLGTTVGLLAHNWYPSRVFVGDTFCYYSGMLLAVAGVLGHFSKTLMLFFVPQIINFLLSVPQLFKLVPCPRHRLPRVDPATGLLGPSYIECAARECSVGARTLKMRKDPAAKCSGDPATHTPNMTLIVLVLRVLGPMRERNLTLVLLLIQAVCCVGAFVVRYPLADYVF